jgi:hypothetical protein
MSFRFICTAFLLLSLVKPPYAGGCRPSLSYMRDHSKQKLAGDTAAERRRHSTTKDEDDVFAASPVSSWRRPAHADPTLKDEDHGGRRRTSHSKEALGSESSDEERSAQKNRDAQQQSDEEYIRDVALTSSWN